MSNTLKIGMIGAGAIADAHVESFYLHGMNIKPCAACDACRRDIKDNCVIEDDMQILYPKIVGVVYGRAGKAGAIKANRPLLRQAREFGRKLAT